MRDKATGMTLRHRSAWRRRLVLAVLSVWAAVPNFGCAAPANARDGFLDLLSQTYSRYAWVAVFSVTPPMGSTPLAMAEREELERVFAPELAHALLADRRRAEMRGEVGAIDFDLLFDSQDPIATDLAFRPGAHALEARACFKDGTGEVRCLVFQGIELAGGVRVTDIVYPRGESLRRLLGLAPR